MVPVSFVAGHAQSGASASRLGRFLSMEWILVIHAVCLVLLSAYALHQAVLLILFLARRRPVPEISRRGKAAGLSSIESITQPAVTIQIPIFNERSVAERIIAAAAAQDYPRDRFCIQVLDDSTDETVTIVRKAVEKAREAGVAIQLLHRADRAGFKAGAMNEGLQHTNADLIAIFDADFIPAPDFLTRVICQRQAFADPRIGFAQTRWDYLNRDDSAITRAQAITLDMHFVIEQPARCNHGLLMNFNGSGGIWRRACIDDAGGWEADTMTEDLDLSYRAELRGWRGVYFGDESAPGELPDDILAYKRQQARWARGTLQTVRKLMPAIFRSTLPLRAKLAAWMHLSGYFVHPLILVITLTMPVLLLRTWLMPGSEPLPAWVNAASVLTAAPLLSMFVAHQARGRSLLVFLRDMPIALMIGVGLSFSNSMSMLRALVSRQKGGEWIPTPKGMLKVAGKPQAKKRKTDWTMWIELGLAIYAIVALVIIVQFGLWAAVLPLLLYVAGFGGLWLSQVVGTIERWND
jgi:cellulose synthase/poly-beta-1,6-N-acetylglucosamine synthase-like glycosyltransferase